MATATLNADPVNDAPTARNDLYTTAEDQPFTPGVPGAATLTGAQLLRHSERSPEDTGPDMEPPVVVACRVQHRRRGHGVSGRCA